MTTYKHAANHGRSGNDLIRPQATGLAVPLVAGPCRDPEAAGSEGRLGGRCDAAAPVFSSLARTLAHRRRCHRAGCSSLVKEL